MKRRGVWKALYRDDPRLLAAHLTSVKDVRDAYTGLWNPDKKSGKKDVHLLDVVLLQQTGVNYDQGRAMRCYSWLNSVFPRAYTAGEKEWAIRKYHARYHTHPA